jgi:probable rRNA maturation factor
MVIIKNTQRKIKLDTAQIKKHVERIMQLLDYADFDISIIFVNNDTMQKYNRDYRGKNKPTDILSFQAHENAQPDKRIRVAYADEKILGDLILAPDYIQTDLDRWQQSFDERMLTLLVHGICHLVGYDHETDADYKIMHQKEQWILKNL